MGGSYRQCSECGKRALSIATRCPGCGRELEPQAAPKTRPVLEVGRYLPPGVVAVVVLAAVVLVVEFGGDRLSSDSARSSAAAGSTGTDSIAGSSEVAYAMGATAQLDSASVEATPAGGTLVAKTWTNVRQSRSRRGELAAVLSPGDTVFADSLQRDWYRVAFQGEVMGYAHRSTLTTPGR
jgi:hypothetical protein